MKARGNCGSSPMTAAAIARPKTDERGVYAELKSIVMGASVACAMLKVRRCPYALARGAAPAVRAARRVESGLWSPARSTAGFLDLVEIAAAETARVYMLARQEATTDGQ